MTRRRWLVVCLFLVPTSVAFGILIGIMLPQFSSTRTGQQSSRVPAATGIHIEEVESLEKILALAGQENSMVFKYSGCDLEFWIEHESEGKSEKFAQGVRVNGELLGSVPAKTPGLEQTVEGHFIWVRSDPDESGSENWTVALQRDLVAPKLSGVQVSTPIVQAKEEREGVNTSLRGAVQIWQGKPHMRHISSYGVSEIPTPFPTDRDVCISQFKEDGTDSKKKSVGQHVIRVMCRVVSEIDIATKSQVSGK